MAKQAGQKSPCPLANPVGRKHITLTQTHRSAPQIALSKNPPPGTEARRTAAGKLLLPHTDSGDTTVVREIAAAVGGGEGTEWGRGRCRVENYEKETLESYFMHEFAMLI